MRTLGITALVLALAACDDALDQRLAILDEQPRALAVIAEPAEARPGDPVAYSVLVATSAGPYAATPGWAYCHVPKPPTEDNIVSVECFDDSTVLLLGTGPTVNPTLPHDACLVFGPETKPGGYRPRDPDPTGGFFQPVRLTFDQQIAFGLSRIQCTLSNVAPEISRQFEREYVPNMNPTLEPLAIPAEVSADTDVPLGASWPATAAESYLYYDPVRQALVTRRESMRVSWFATGGALAVDASAVGEADPATSVATTWHTPAAGPAWVFAVLRDSRGGIATQIVTVSVR